jgi:histidinol-phosphate phosphatase family protein
MSKRIAMISEHASPLGALGGVDSGGQNVYVAQVAKYLAQIGFEVDVFTRRDDPRLPEIVPCEPGVRVIHVPAGPPEQVRKESLLQYMSQFTDYVLSFCRRENPFDLIHANFFMSGLVGADLKRALGIPLAVTFHALGHIRRQHHGKADGFPEERIAIEQRVMREADCIIAECPQDKADQIELYGADPKRICIIPCGFDPEELWPLDRLACRQRLMLDPNELLILQLGRMVPRKGVDNAIEALARLHHKHGVQARLLVVGGESAQPDPITTPEIGRLQQVAAAEDIADWVTFVGRRGRYDLKYLYSAVDIFVTTPWYEPFGITPLEAMACGTPVVGSDVGGIKFSVEHGETGLLVPPRDPDALAESLATLGKDKELRERMGAQAIRRANNHFTWPKVAASIGDEFERLLTGKQKHVKRLPRTTRSIQRRSKAPSSRSLSRAVFCDKDGTLIPDIPYNVNTKLIRLCPGVASGLWRLQQAGFRLIVVSNQSGVAQGRFQLSDLEAVETRLTELLAENGITLHGFYCCPHDVRGSVSPFNRRCDCRKPEPGLLVRAAKGHGIVLDESWMIGDILNDVEAGRRAGCRTVLIDNGNETKWNFSPQRLPDYFARDFAEATRMILRSAGVGASLENTSVAGGAR